MTLNPAIKPLVVIVGFVTGLVALYLMAFLVPIAAILTFAGIDTPRIVVQPFLWLNQLFYNNPFNFGGAFAVGFCLGFYYHLRWRTED